MANSVLRGVIRGVISSIFGGGGGVNPVCWPEPITPCSTETERYLWIMDGQDDFWLRAETWQCVDPVIEMSFIGYTPASTYILFDGDTSGTDRAFAFINATTGYVNCPSAQTLELNGVVVSPNTLASKPVEGEENHIKITFTGNFRVGVVGCRFSRDTAFSLTPITAIKLTDPADGANTHTTKFVNNEAYQLELGGTSVNSTTFYRENEEPDGSDIVDITRKPDNSGWTGDGLDYDYADGSFPICWPEPIGPCSTAMQRYLWEMDGQSMYWRRESSDYGQTTNARLRVAFTGGSGIGVQYLVGRHSNDRFYIALDGGDVIFGNGVNPAQSPTTVDLSEINLAELVADGTDVKWYINNVLIATQAQSWTGLLDDVGFGVRGEQQSDFYSGSIYAVAVETDSENDVYTLDGNGPTEFPIGSTNSSAKLTRENNELDGSDIITINRQPDNSGWTGGGTVYDYATGARRDLGAYSAEYSESYGA